MAGGVEEDSRRVIHAGRLLFRRAEETDSIAFCTGLDIRAVDAGLANGDTFSRSMTGIRAVEWDGEGCLETGVDARYTVKSVLSRGEADTQTQGWRNVDSVGEVTLSLDDTSASTVTEHGCSSERHKRTVFSELVE